MTLLDDLAKRLEQAELGVYTEDAGRNIYTSSLPESPDEAIVIYEYTGLPPTWSHSSQAPTHESPNAQIVVRSQLYEDARAKAQQAFIAISVHNWYAPSGIRYLHIMPAQSPFSIGIDQSGRERVGFNLNILKETSNG